MRQPDDLELSIVIPAYLEEENLHHILPPIKKTAAELNVSFEIIIVDTETPLDKTPEACAEHGVRHVPRTGGATYGDAVRSGIAAAGGKYTLFMDADGSHPPDVIGKLFPHKKKHDLVIASRYIEGGETENPWVLIFMSRVLNWTYRWILNVDCKDVSNSFRLYRSEQLKAINLYCSNFDIVEEIIYKLNKTFGIRIKEVPFTFNQRLHGKSKRNLLLFMLTYGYTILKLRFGR